MRIGVVLLMIRKTPFYAFDAIFAGRGLQTPPQAGRLRDVTAT